MLDEEASYFSSVSSIDSACAVNVSSTLCAEYIPIGELYCCGMNTLTRPEGWRLICSKAAERGGGNPATPAAGSTANNPIHTHRQQCNHLFRVSLFLYRTQHSRNKVAYFSRMKAITPGHENET